MNLQVSATYLPDADEVQVDFRSTQDDLVTLSVADLITVSLQVSSQDLNGTVTYRPLAQISASPEYVQAEKNYLLRFRHPRRRQDLFVNVSAVYGVQTFQKTVSVGISASPQTEMALPDNALWVQDPFNVPLDQGNNPGSGHHAPNANQVVLSPRILDYVQKFDFTLAQNSEDFDPLIYQGGGNRLLMSNKTQAFESQVLNQSPWDLSAYAFMEPAAQNLLPNSFFNVIAQGIPSGYTLDSVGAILTQSVLPNYQTATGAQFWTLRFRQTNLHPASNQARVGLQTPIILTGSENYAFSVYVQITPLTSVTKVTELTLGLLWQDASGVTLQTSQVTLNPNDYPTLSLASLTAKAPVGAAQVVPEILLGSIDAGDDVQLVLFSPQLEPGMISTSRCQGARAEDTIEIPTYDAGNQKIRLEFTPGFTSGPVQITTGPLEISFTAQGTLLAEIPEASVSVETQALSFQPGDTLDFTIQHQAGGSFMIYQGGDAVAETLLPQFTSTPAPLLIRGFLGELLHLSVFSRK